VFRSKDDQAGPLALFVHGGYWMSFDKDHFSHMARGLEFHGVPVAVPSYRLCPDVRITDIIEDMRRCCLFLWQRYSRRLVIAGHSAGGHLAAAMLATDWKALGAPEDLVIAGFGISGIYDMRPLIPIAVNQLLKLDDAEARCTSPLLWPTPTGCLRGLGRRGRERRVPAPEPHDRRRLARRRRRCALSRAPGADHFRVIAPLAQPDSDITRALRAALRRAVSATVSVETPSGKGAGDENFPVGSFLIARPLRPHVAAYYAFARAIDDIADNPELAPEEKLERLDAMDRALCEDTAEPMSSPRPRPAPVAARNRRRFRPCPRPRLGLQAGRNEGPLCRLGRAHGLLRPVGRAGRAVSARAARRGPAALRLLRRPVQRAAGHQPSAGLRRGLPQSRPGVSAGRLAGEEGETVEALARPHASPGLRRVLDRCLAHTRELMAQADLLPGALASRRLAMESAIIVRIAHRLVASLSAAIRWPSGSNSPGRSFWAAGCGGLSEGCSLNHCPHKNKPPKAKASSTKITNSTPKIANRILEILAAPAEMPLRPRAPATSEMTRKMMAHLRSDMGSPSSAVAPTHRQQEFLTARSPRLTSSRLTRGPTVGRAPWMLEPEQVKRGRHHGMGIS
jgi:arylformamidase